MNTRTTADALQLIYPYYQSLFRQAYSLCSDADQAEDLACDTLLHAAERLHTFNGGSLRAWLGTSLQRRFLDSCRRPRCVALILWMVTFFPPAMLARKPKRLAASSPKTPLPNVTTQVSFWLSP